MRAACGICTDLFEDKIKTGAPPCGHVFHFKCLNTWIKNSNTCPQCRSYVSESNILNLYYHIDPSDQQNAARLENKVSNLKAQMAVKDFLLMQCEKEKREIDAKYIVADFKVSKLQGKAKWHKYQLAELSSKLKSLTQLKATVRMLKRKNETLSRELRQLNNFQLLLYGSSKSAEVILEKCGVGPEGNKMLATYCYALKEKLMKAVKEKDELKEKYDLDFAKAKQNINKLQEKVSYLEQKNCSLQWHLNIVRCVMSKVSGEIESIAKADEERITKRKREKEQHYFLRSQQMTSSEESGDEMPKRRCTRNTSVGKIASRYKVHNFKP